MLHKGNGRSLRACTGILCLLAGIMIRAVTASACVIVDPNIASEPAHLAAYSTLIVRARISEKGPLLVSRQADREHHLPLDPHPAMTPDRLRAIWKAKPRKPVEYQDVLLDQVEVLWKDSRVPETVPHRVRLAKGAHRLGSLKPEVHVGETFVFCLTETDALSADVGPDHWRVLGGADGAFLVRGDRVSRRHATEPFIRNLEIGDISLGRRLIRQEWISYDELKSELLKGAQKDKLPEAEYGLWKRQKPSGILLRRK